MLAKITPGRLPKVVQKWSKNQWKINFIENPDFYALDLAFYVPVGVRGTPLAAKTPKFYEITCKNTSVSINFCWICL